MVVEGKARSSSAAGGGGGGAEGKVQGRAVRREVPGQGYFTAGLAALFLCLTALLVFLPLVLPPLPPPPPVLLVVVPVGLVAVLVALALLPADGRSSSRGVLSSCL
ncbi:hypothetical protein ACP70R_039933 [Stipagrostis hirtigluma subsp. patula]